MLVAAYAGAGPGLLATFFSSLAIAWFDLGFDDAVRLAVFTVTALVISSISAARQAAEHDLRKALDDLAAFDRSKDEFIATVSHAAHQHPSHGWRSSCERPRHAMR